MRHRARNRGERCGRLTRAMRIGSLFGIEISINASWIFIFALVAWTFANPLGPLRMPALSPLERGLLGIFASLLFFASVLGHELAHSLVARRRGIPVRGITLMIFGGISTIEGEPETAPAEAWISGVGPLASLIFGALFFAAGATLGRSAPIGAIAFYLGFANVTLAIFNLLPAYPLDGGRVLHAILWRLLRDRDGATRWTVGIGRVIAFGLIVLGVVQTLTFGFGGGLWTTFIGWYLLQAGNVEQTRTTVVRALAGHTAGELAAPAEFRLAANATATTALGYMREHAVRALPVLLGERFIGVLTVDDIAHAPAQERERSFVTSLMKRAEDVPRVPAAASASDVVRDMVRTNDAAVALTDEVGDYVGLFTRESVMQWIARTSHIGRPALAPR